MVDLRSQSRSLSQRPDIVSYSPSHSPRKPVLQSVLNAQELETPKVPHRPPGPKQHGSAFHCFWVHLRTAITTSSRSSERPSSWRENCQLPR